MSSMRGAGMWAGGGADGPELLLPRPGPDCPARPAGAPAAHSPGASVPLGYTSHFPLHRTRSQRRWRGGSVHIQSREKDEHFQAHPPRCTVAGREGAKRHSQTVQGAWGSARAAVPFVWREECFTGARLQAWNPGAAETGDPPSSDIRLLSTDVTKRGASCLVMRLCAAWTPGGSPHAGLVGVRLFLLESPVS